MELDDTALIDVQGTQLERVLRQSRGEVIAGLIGVAIALVATFGSLPLGTVLLWSALTVLSYAARFFLIEGRHSVTPELATVKRRSQVFLVTLAATGCCWGALAAYAIATTGLLPSLPILLLACAACVSTLAHQAGWEIGSLTVVTTTFVPPITALLLAIERSGVYVIAGIALFSAAVIVGARRLKGQVWEAAALRERAKNLTSYLDQRRDQVERLNVELKTTLAKHEHAEQSLRRTSADLGLAQGKAKALADTLERISPNCQVTGLANRRHFEQLFEGEWRRAGREGKVVSIVVVDIDDFQEYLETYGRQSADALLKRIATTLKGFGRRAGDTAGRYDDTKLALLLPGCEVRNATRMAEAARKRIEGQAIPNANAKNGQLVTIHCGVAMIKPTRSMASNELLKRVDTAIYEAHFQGGNRVVAYQPLSKLRIERWDTPRDGPLNEQSLLQKLLVWGYDTTKLLMRPGTIVEPEIVPEELVLAIASGELKIDVEGHTMIVKPGDCVFIPQGVELGMEVVGDRQVLKFTAGKNK